MCSDIFSAVSRAGFVASTNRAANCAALGYSECRSNIARMTSVYPGDTLG